MISFQWAKCVILLATSITIFSCGNKELERFKEEQAKDSVEYKGLVKDFFFSNGYYFPQSSPVQTIEEMPDFMDTSLLYINGFNYCSGFDTTGVTLYIKQTGQCILEVRCRDSFPTEAISVEKGITFFAFRSMNGTSTWWVVKDYFNKAVVRDNYYIGWFGNASRPVEGDNAVDTRNFLNNITAFSNDKNVPKVICFGCSGSNSFPGSEKYVLTDDEVNMLSKGNKLSELIGKMNGRQLQIDNLMKE